MGNIRDLGPHPSPRDPIYPESPPLYRIIRNKYSKINNLSIYQHGSSTAFWVTDKIKLEYRRYAGSCNESL